LENEPVIADLCNYFGIETKQHEQIYVDVPLSTQQHAIQDVCEYNNTTIRFYPAKYAVSARRSGIFANLSENNQLGEPSDVHLASDINRCSQSFFLPASSRRSGSTCETKCDTALFARLAPFVSRRWNDNLSVCAPLWCANATPLRGHAWRAALCADVFIWMVLRGRDSRDQRDAM